MNKNDLQRLHEETIKKVLKLEKEGKVDEARFELMCFIQTYKTNKYKKQLQQDHLQYEADQSWQ